MTTQSHPQVPDQVAAMFAAVKRGDISALRGCFAPGATVWHSPQGVDLNVDQVCGMLAGLFEASTSRSYEGQRITRADHTCFVQHTLTAPLRSGHTLSMRTIMRIDLAPNGQVARIEEYFDSRAVDCLAPS